MEVLRILIISDSLTFSEGLKSLLQFEPQLNVIGQEMDVSRVINSLKQLKPDVVIWASTGLSRDALWDELRLLAATPTIRTVSINCVAEFWCGCLFTFFSTHYIPSTRLIPSAPYEVAAVVIVIYSLPCPFSWPATER